MKHYLRIVAAIISGLLSLAATLFFLVWIFNRSPIPLSKLSDLDAGATKEQVRMSLGTPTRVYDNDRKWAYSRPLGWSIVYVYFDDKGRLDRYEYDY